VFLAVDHELAGNQLMEVALAHSGVIGLPGPIRQFAVASQRPGNGSTRWRRCRLARASGRLLDTAGCKRCWVNSYRAEPVGTSARPGTASPGLIERACTLANPTPIPLRDVFLGGHEQDADLGEVRWTPLFRAIQARKRCERMLTPPQPHTL
jgi:hypothetical protein